MKILFPLEIFYPTTVGGPSSTVFWHTCYLKEKGVENFIVTTDRKLDFEKHKIVLNNWIENDAGKVIYCKTRFGPLPFRAFFEVVKKLYRVDIVHYSSAYYYLTIYTFLIGILFGTKIVISPRGEFFENAINSSKKRFVIKLYQLFQTKIHFHGTSESEIKTIQRLFPKSEKLLQPNFVKLSTRIKSSIISKNIVFLGIIYPVKKIENIIKAVSMSKYFKEFNSKLLIAGKPLVKRDFIYKKELQKLIIELNLGQQVEFIGEVFKDKKEDFLYNANVLVLASETENFGNVVVEAQAQSTPVIASYGTPWKVLEDSNAGWWVSNDPDSLAQAVDEALSLSEVDYLIKSRNALELLNSTFSIDTSTSNNWMEIYKGIKNERN